MVKIDGQRESMVVGYCVCGRKNGYVPNPKYCSLYCLKFMTEPVDGFKKKTHYDVWYGSGKFALNPAHPKLDCECQWCGNSYKLSYSLSKANKSYCGETCSREAMRGMRSKDKINKRGGNTSTKVRIMRVLRLTKTEMSANDISNYIKKWFKVDCSTPSVSNLLRLLYSKNMVYKYQTDNTTTMTYKIHDESTPLKQLFY
jgi:DNA-binding transcriptional ArsR family regulator